MQQDSSCHFAAPPAGQPFSLMDTSMLLMATVQTPSIVTVLLKKDVFLLRLEYDEVINFMYVVQSMSYNYNVIILLYIGSCKTFLVSLSSREKNHLICAIISLSKRYHSNQITHFFLHLHKTSFHSQQILVFFLLLLKKQKGFLRMPKNYCINFLPSFSSRSQHR